MHAVSVSLKINKLKKKNAHLCMSTWVAQLVKYLTLDFGSGHDLTVHEFKPCIRLASVSIEPASDPLSPSLSAPVPLVLSLSLKNK